MLVEATFTSSPVPGWGWSLEFVNSWEGRCSMRSHHFGATAFFVSGAAGAIARNHAEWSATRLREETLGLATLRRPDPYRSVSRLVAVSARECAACSSPCDISWGVVEDEVVFCIECRERACPELHDELGGSG